MWPVQTNSGLFGLNSANDVAACCKHTCHEVVCQVLCQTKATPSGAVVARANIGYNLSCDSERLIFFFFFFFALVATCMLRV